MRRVAAGAMMAAILAAPVFAAAVTEIDTDGDARASYAELALVHPDLGKDVFLKVDLDRDGFLDDKELEVALEEGLIAIPEE